MRSFFQTALSAVKIVGRIFIGLLAISIVFFLFIQPMARGWWLRHELLVAIDDATSIQVIEHSLWSDNRFDPNYKEITYAKITLTPEQIELLRKALPLRFDFSASAMLMCLFQEHHYIQINQRNGSVVTLHICFHCGEIKLNDQSQRVMPWGWSSSLSQFISSLGLRPDGPWKK